MILINNIIHKVFLSFLEQMERGSVCGTGGWKDKRGRGCYPILQRLFTVSIVTLLPSYHRLHPLVQPWRGEMSAGGEMGSEFRAIIGGVSVFVRGSKGS